MNTPRPVIIVRTATIKKIVDDYFDSSEEPNDDMWLSDAREYIDKLIAELKKPKGGKFMAYGGSNYGGNGSAMGAVINIVKNVLKVVDTKNIVKIELQEVYQDNYAFKGDIKKYEKYVKARFPIEEDEGQSGVPEFFDEYTTTIKSMEGTEAEQLLYKQTLIKNLEETDNQIGMYEFR